MSATGGRLEGDIHGSENSSKGAIFLYKLIQCLEASYSRSLHNSAEA